MLSTPMASSSGLGDRSNGQDVHFQSQSQLHTVIAFLITTLGGYLEVQYQSRKISPFDEHSNIMSAALVLLFIYALGLMAEYKLQTHNSTYFSIIKRFTSLTGILVVVLLLIILLPLLGLVAFILWALLMLEAVIKSSQEIRKLFRHVFLLTREIITAYSGSHETGSEENESPPVEEGNELPV